MDKQDEKNETLLPYPPSEFWIALLAVRNYAFAKGLDEYSAERGLPRQGSFRESIDIVDNYLTLAINDGWLEDGPE